MPILSQGASIDLAVNGDSTLTLQSPVGGFVTVENPVGTVIWRGGQSSRQIDVKSGTVRITANTRDVDYALNTDPLNGIPVLYDPLTGQMSANGSPVSGAGNSAAAISKIFSGAGTAISLNTTIVTQHPARRASFSAVKLVYGNWSTSGTITVTTCRVSPTPTHQNDGSATTWTTIVLPSAGVVPQASGTGNDIVPGILVSDVIPVASVARTDDTTKNALLQCRSYFAAAASGISLGGSDIAAFNASSAASGMQFAARTPAGDATATFTASQQPLEAGSWIVPAGVIFYYPGVKSITLASAGDSLQKGHLTTGGATGWVERMAGLLCTSTVEVSPCVWAWTGQTHAASISIARSLITTLKPTYLVFAAWSPNDAAAGSHTQAIFDAGLARALDLIEYCRQNGVKPVIVTCMPWNGLTQAESDRRRALNATLRTLSNVARIVDAAAVLEDPANPKNMVSWGDSGDGLHPNDAGHAAVATAAAAGGPLA